MKSFFTELWQTTKRLFSRFAREIRARQREHVNSYMSYTGKAYGLPHIGIRAIITIVTIVPDIMLTVFNFRRIIAFISGLRTGNYKKAPRGVAAKADSKRFNTVGYEDTRPTIEDEETVDRFVVRNLNHPIQIGMETLSTYTKATALGTRSDCPSCRPDIKSDNLTAFSIRPYSPDKSEYLKGFSPEQQNDYLDLTKRVTSKKPVLHICTCRINLSTALREMHSASKKTGLFAKKRRGSIAEHLNLTLKTINKLININKADISWLEGCRDIHINYQLNDTNARKRDLAFKDRDTIRRSKLGQLLKSREGVIRQRHGYWDTLTGDDDGS